MSSHLSETVLSQIARFVNQRMGLNYPRDRWRDLERGVRSACDELGYTDIAECAQQLCAGSAQKSTIDLLARHLTIGETYFLREPKTFEALEQEVLPALIRSRRDQGDRRLRIWTAGCATGEEPYSLAITVSRVLADIKDWNVTILATDINAQFLRTAARGVYGQWSFRDTPLWWRQKYFTKHAGERHEVLPQIKQMVTFAPLNLVEDMFPSLFNNTNAMDIIFCRNVLMYFSNSQSQNVIAKFASSLVPGGWFIVSATETSPILYGPLASVMFPGITFYRKDGATTKGLEPLHTPLVQTKSKPAPLPTSHPQVPHRAKKGPPKPAPSHVYDEAFSLHHQQRYTEAATKLEGLLDEHPRNAAAATLLARVYANQGELDRALRWCDRALSTHKLDAGLHYLRATVLQERGAIHDCTTALKRALFIDHHFVLAHFALGNIAMHENRLQNARKHFDNALSSLQPYSDEQLLPGSEGLTAGRLREIITATMPQEETAA